jgi:hypothetical protein|tara:strand:+ start:16257 stop:16442 length:186 start_codon:yes stop_codon:yes gene_type:complete
MDIPVDDDYEKEVVEIDLDCLECSADYSVFTNTQGYLEQARYCPFCGFYNVDYDRIEEELE